MDPKAKSNNPPPLKPKASWRSTFSTVLHLEEEENDSQAGNESGLEHMLRNDKLDTSETKMLSREDLLGLSRVRTMPLSALLADMPQSIHNKIISTSLLSAQTKLQRQRKIEEYVLGCIHARFFLRHYALKLADSSIFETLVTIVVLCNAVIFGLADPIASSEYWGNRAIRNSENFFSYFYALEACLKIFAFGLGVDRMLENYFGKGLCDRKSGSDSKQSPSSERTTTMSSSSSSSSLNVNVNNKSCLPVWLKSTTDSVYFASSWNQLDFIVAVLGILQLHSSSFSIEFLANVTAVRTLRLLRPLRSIMMLDGARVILDAIKTSLRGFLDVFLLVLLSCFAFALVAVELWRGNMKGHCGYVNGNSSSFVFLGIDSFLQNPIGCGLPCSDIPYGQKCRYGQNGGGDLCPVLIAPFTNISSSSSNSSVFYDWTETSCRNTDAFASAEVNYDNVVYGMLNAFTFITTEGWSQAMYAVWHHFGYPELVSTLFVIHVFFGSAFVLELALAVLWERYTAVSLADEDRENAFHMLIVRRLGFDEEALEITRKAAKRAVEYLDGPLHDSKECKEAIKLATYASSKAPLRDHIQQEAKEFIFGDPNDAVFQEEQEKELLGGRRLSEVVDLKYIRQELVVYATDVARAAQLDQDVATAIHTLRSKPLTSFENESFQGKGGSNDGFLDKMKAFGYAAESKFHFLSTWTSLKKKSPADENNEQESNMNRTPKEVFASPKSLRRSPNFKDANSVDSRQNALAAEMRAFAEKKKLKGFVNDKVRRQLALQKKALMVFAVRNAGVLKGSKSFGPSAVEVTQASSEAALLRQLEKVKSGEFILTPTSSERAVVTDPPSDHSPSRSSSPSPPPEKSTPSGTPPPLSTAPSQKAILRTTSKVLRSTSNIRGANKLLRVGTKKQLVMTDVNDSQPQTGSLGSSNRSIPGGDVKTVFAATSAAAALPSSTSSPQDAKDDIMKRSLSILHQTETAQDFTMKDVAKMRNVFIPWRTSAVLHVPKPCQRLAYCCCGCGCAPDITNDDITGLDESSSSSSHKQSEYQFEEAQFEIDVESEAHKQRVRNGVFNRCCCRGKQAQIFIRHPPSFDEFFRYVVFGIFDVYMSITPSIPVWLSRPAHFIVDHWIFKLVSMSCVFANIVVLGLVYHGMSEEYVNGLELCNFIFVCIFGAELFLKLIGFGPQLLFSDIYNVFDALIVIFSIVDATVVTSTVITNVTPLRVLRIARVFKLLRTWRNLRVLMGALAIGLGKAVNAFMLLFFIIYLFAVIGMQIFGPYYEQHAKETGEPIPFSNFQSLFWSVITVFQVMDNENWDSVVNYHKSMFGLSSVLFFLLAFVIGNFIFLNLFITILMTVLQTPPMELIDSIENGLEHDLELSHDNDEDDEENDDDVDSVTNGSSGSGGSGGRKGEKHLDMHAFDPEKDIPDVHTPRTPEHSLKLGVAEIVDAKGKKPAETRTKNKPKLFRSESARFLPAVSKFKRFMRIRAIRAAMQSCPFCINHAAVHASSPSPRHPSSANRSQSPSPPGSRTPNKSIDGTGTAAAPVVKSALKDPQASRLASLPSQKDFEKSAVDRHGRLIPQAAAVSNAFQSDSKTSLRTTSTQSVPSQDVPSDPSQSDLQSTESPDEIGGRGVGNLLNRVSPPQPVASSPISLSSSLQSISHHTGDDASGGATTSTTAQHHSSEQHHSHKIFHKEASRLVMVPNLTSPNQASSVNDAIIVHDSGKASSTPSAATTTDVKQASKSSKFAGTKSKFIDLEDAPKITKPVINVVTSESGVAQSVEIYIPASKVSAEDTDNFNPSLPYSVSGGESSGAMIETEPIRIIVSSDGVIRIILASETEKKAMLAEAHKQRKIKRLQNLRTSCCFPSPGSTFSALFPCFSAARNAREEAVTNINRFESFRAWFRRGIFFSSNKVLPEPSSKNVNVQSSGGQNHQQVDTLDWIVDKVADFIAFPVSSELDDEKVFPHNINLGCCKLNRRSKLRRPFLYLYKWFWFDFITILTTVIACINLALDSPTLNECATTSCKSLFWYLEVSEIVCVSVFALEVLIISMARGFIDKPYSSLRNGWYQLDIITIATSIAALAYVDSTAFGVNVLGTFRIVRASRVIRVLRTISLMPSLRIVIDAIILAFGRAKETVGVLLVIMYVFAVLGLQSFLGGSMTCSDAGPGMFSTGGADYCQGTYIARGGLCKMANSTEMESLCRDSPQGLELPRIWYSHPWNFDNIGSAMLIVFELLTGENWPTLMSISVGYAGKDMSPVKNNSMWAALYYVAIQMVLNQLLIELFSGVIIDTYLELRANSDNMSLLTDDQKLWVTNMKVMLSSRPVRLLSPPNGSGYIKRFRTWLFNIVVAPAFDLTILLLIVLQVFLHSTQYFDWAVSQTDSLNLASEVLTWIFVSELVVKVIALGVDQFSNDWWNQFDCIVVLGSAISSAVSEDETTWISKLFRIVRTLRVLRLLKLSAGLLRLLRALYLALPSLSNVSFILLLIVYIYAVIGINAFSGVRTGWFGYINEDANFNSFGSAYITLIRSMTGENYNGLMHDLMVEPPFCIPGKNCGSVWFTVLFFVSFYTVTAFMVLNILTAVVMEAYDGCSDETETSSFFESVSGEKQTTYRLTPVAMEQYLLEWNKRDLEGTQFLPKNDLVDLLINLNFPLGLKGDKRLMSTVRSGPGGEDKLEVRQRMQARNILKKLPLVPRDSDGKYHFHAVLHALMDRASGGSALGAPTDAVRIDGSHKASGLSLLMTDKLVNMQRQLRKKVKQSVTHNSIDNQTSHSEINDSSPQAVSPITDALLSSEKDISSSPTSSSTAVEYSKKRSKVKENDSEVIANPLDSKHDRVTKHDSKTESPTSSSAATSPSLPLPSSAHDNSSLDQYKAKKEMPKYKVLKSVPSLVFMEDTEGGDGTGVKQTSDTTAAVEAAAAAALVTASLPPLKRLQSDLDVVETHQDTK